MPAVMRPGRCSGWPIVVGWVCGVVEDGVTRGVATGAPAAPTTEKARLTRHAVSSSPVTCHSSLYAPGGLPGHRHRDDGADG